MMLSLIAAVSENGVIGRNGDLPWRLSADLRRFKRLTMGHTIVMGRKTYESIARPLPGRRMVVVSRNRSYQAEHAAAAASLDEAVELAAGDDEVFIIGGAEIYRLALAKTTPPVVERLYLTRVHATIDGDVYFPEVNLSAWNCVEESRHAADAKNEFDFTFATYDHREQQAALPSE